MKNDVIQIARQLAEQKKIGKDLPEVLSPSGEAAAPATGLSRILRPKEDREILEGLAGKRFGEQVLLFSKMPSKFYLLRDLLSEYEADERTLSGWTVYTLVLLGNLMEIMIQLMEKGDETVRTVLRSALEMLNTGDGGSRGSHNR